MAQITNAKKIEQLKALGVTLTGEEKAKDLDALLEQYAPTVEDDEEIDETEETDEDESEEDADIVSVEYHNPQTGLTIRQFTREDHGKDFKKTAKQFAEKFEGKIV